VHGNVYAVIVLAMITLLLSAVAALTFDDWGAVGWQARYVGGLQVLAVAMHISWRVGMGGRRGARVSSGVARAPCPLWSRHWLSA